MNSTTSERRSLRHNPASTGWNAINHAPFAHSPQPTPEPPLRVESESPFYKTPEPPKYPPILPPTRAPIISVSEGIKRTGAWLEHMAKRRQAAQATVKVSSEILESPPEQSPSTISPQSSICEGSNNTSPILSKVQETRIIPGCMPRRTQYPSSSPIQPKPYLDVQVVVPMHRGVQAQMFADQSQDQCPAGASRSTQSPVSSVQSFQLSEIMESGESDASSVDSVEPEVEQSEDEDQEVFEVERILNERNVYGEVQFLVKWANYPEQSWISEDDCDCEDLIRQFRTRARRSRLRKSRSSCSNPQQHGPESGDQVDQRNLRAERRATVNAGTQIDLPLYSKRPTKRGRDRKTEKFEQISVSKFAASLEKRTDQCSTVMEEGHVLPRNVRANTARYSPRPAVVHTRWNETTGQIDWTRSAREERWRRIAERRAKVSERPEQSEMDQVISRKGVRERGRCAGDAPAQRSHIINGDRQQQGCQSSEQHSQHQHERHRSSAPVPPAINPNRKYKTPPQSRAPIHIRFDDNAMPIKLSPHDTVQLLQNISPNRRASYNDDLRQARIQEKRSSGPSLLRHEFSGEMSHKHAEALINQTRRSPTSPERAFGFSLPSQLAANSVLDSIEKDDD